MVKYKISYTLPHKHILQIEAEFDVALVNKRTFALAAWRPGRYELQNYPQHLLRITAKDSRGKTLPIRKKDVYSWQVTGCKNERVTISYQYVADKIDAGSTFLDEDIQLLNFINFVLYENHDYESIYEVFIQSSPMHVYAGSLKSQKCPGGYLLEPVSYRLLCDSPVLISGKLYSTQFCVGNADIFVHFHNKRVPDAVLQNLKDICATQTKLFGNLPTRFYHFLGVWVDYPFYHGVEHTSSTCMVLGAEPDVPFPHVEFLGLASHELFHVWNVCQIKPAPLVRFNVSKPVLFDTCYIAEGITTYYGDLMILRSGVWNLDTWLLEFNTHLQKHFSNPARHDVSLTQSSLELWVDGYKATNCYRKVSVYDKGALAAFILDMELRLKTNNQYSLDSVMQEMWRLSKSGTWGYTSTRFRRVIEQLSGVSLHKYFKHVIYGVAPLEQILAKAASWIGLTLHVCSSADFWEYALGLKLQKIPTKGYKIVAIAPGCAAEKHLAVDDLITHVNQCQFEHLDMEIVRRAQMIHVTLIRRNQTLQKSIVMDGGCYWNVYALQWHTDPTHEQVENRKVWLQQI